MNDMVIFSLMVGIGSTMVLDLWAFLLFKLKGIAPTDWGQVGRWLLGLRNGEWVARQDNQAPISKIELCSGWMFHYLVGIAYAVIIALTWGQGFIRAPTLMPIISVGLILSTIAGLTLFMPAMGAGFCGRKLPHPGNTFGMMILAHGVFTLGQYLFALLYASVGIV